MEENKKLAERKAMEDLTLLSETPWLVEQQHQKLYSIYRSVQTRVGQSPIKRQFKDIRPSTQTNHRKRYHWFTTENNENPFNHFSPYKKLQMTTPNYYMSKEPQNEDSSIISRNIRTRSQLRDKMGKVKKNYAKLRKDYEKGFFVGSLRQTAKWENFHKTSTPANKQKKGRLWVGRPVLLFHTDVSNKNII